MIDMTKNKLSNGRYVTKSRHIINRYGYVEVKAEYWSLDNNDTIIENKHSIQQTHSRREKITNSTFKKLFRNCIKMGAVAHSKKFRYGTNKGFTYRVIWYRIIYDTAKMIKIKYNQNKKTVMVKEGKKSVKIKEKKDFKDIRNYIIKKESEERALIKESRKKHKESLIAYAAYKKMRRQNAKKRVKKPIRRKMHKLRR